MDEATAHWRQQGKVHLWQYVNNAHEWHLTADDAGCESLSQLLSHMLAAEFTAKQTIVLSPFTDDVVPAANYPHRYRTYRRWEIAHSQQKHEPSHWRLTATDDVITLEIGAARISELVQGLADIQQRNGDYWIGDDGMELWFWWYVSKR